MQTERLRFQNNWNAERSTMMMTLLWKLFYLEMVASLAQQTQSSSILKFINSFLKFIIFLLRFISIFLSFQWRHFLFEKKTGCPTCIVRNLDTFSSFLDELSIQTQNITAVATYCYLQQGLSLSLDKNSYFE